MRFKTVATITLSLILADTSLSWAFTTSHSPFYTNSQKVSSIKSSPWSHRTSLKHRGGVQLSMMFDQLTSAISNVAKTLGGRNRITEQSITQALKDVRRALVDADVNLKVADTLIEGVKKRSIGQDVIKGITADQQFIKAIYDELLDIMGGNVSDKDFAAKKLINNIPPSTLAIGSVGNPAVILLAGLQGAGKTTAAGKLALYLKEREVDYDAVISMGSDKAGTMLSTRMPTRNRKVLLVAADVYRPAAISQLEILGKNVGVDVFSLGVQADPVDIAKKAVDKAKKEGYDTVLIDTAGRQVIDTNLMDELKLIQLAVKPKETLLVVDAMTGQEAATLTAAFDSAVGITGAILTKMDGDSRGGAAVSVRGVSGKPIMFVGTGEKIPDLEPFYPDRMASRILGMGDIVSLVEKAAVEVSDEEALRLQKKMLEAKFDFDDFLKQSELVTKMGSFAGVAKMLPGIGGQINSAQIKEVELRMKRSKALICSMTKKERSNPELLITDRTARSRLRRITTGSGLSLDQGVAFVSEFQKMRTMMSRMQKSMGMMPQAENPGMMEEMSMAAGNRAMRRAAKKSDKPGRGGGKGFGSKAK